MADKKASRAASLPTFTSDERRAHLRKAAELRLKRSEIKKQFAHGNLSFADIVELAQEEKREGTDKVCAKIRVSEIIRAKPGIGRAKCAHIMDDLAISPTRCVGGLGPRQIEHLCEIM